MYDDNVTINRLLGTSVLKLTERKRPLRVERKERKKVVPQTIENVKILININRAVYVPRRVSARWASCQVSVISCCFCCKFFFHLCCFSENGGLSKTLTLFLFCRKIDWDERSIAVSDEYISPLKYDKFVYYWKKI